jgi:hypothetical protein
VAAGEAVLHEAMARMAAFGADLPILQRSTNAKDCPKAVQLECSKSQLRG